MKILVGLGGSGMLLAGLYAGDTLTPGEVYEVPLEQAYSELSAMPMPTAFTQAAAGIYAPAVDVRRSFPAIAWSFGLDGRTVATFTAHLTPEGTHRTRVQINYEIVDSPNAELRHFTSAKLIQEMARLAMSEQVDALLERRPVDASAFAGAFARHAAPHPEQVEEFEQAIGDTVAGLHRQVNDIGLEAAPSDSWADPPADAGGAFPYGRDD